jgi:transcriptional regulator with XRE-family HTH domain
MDNALISSSPQRLHLPNHIGMQLQQRPVRARLHVIDIAARDLAHERLRGLDPHAGEPIGDLLLGQPGYAECGDDLVGLHVLRIPFGIFCHADGNMQDGLNAGVEKDLATIGQRIKSAREARLWKQADLARASGVSQGTVSKLEAGKMHRGTQLLQLADALGVQLRWLDSGEGPRGLAGESPPPAYHQAADLERSVIQAMRDMPPEDRAAVVEEAKRRADSFQAKLRTYLAEQANPQPAAGPPGQIEPSNDPPHRLRVLPSGTTSERRVDHWNPKTHAPTGTKTRTSAPKTHKPKRGA